MSAMTDVAAERERQNQLWGRQDHTPHEWYPILGEEYGEVGKELADARLGTFNPRKYRAELVQVAAVAIAAIEALDRKDAGTDDAGTDDA